VPNWEGSTRNSRLPTHWAAIRARVLKRDGHQCTHTENGVRCDRPATDVDHIIANDDHSFGNLQSLCSEHHDSKSGREGAAAMHKRRREISQRFRRTEGHPGLL
jgi:5-methylcytosine-specific restriction protein A